MPAEPPRKRTVLFVDGQNLFHSVRESFGYTYPNYDVQALAQALCRTQSWDLAEVRFYTGIPDPADDPYWNTFWTGKLAVMGRQGIRVFSRSLRYRNRTVKLPDGTVHTFLTGEEKGIDVRIALDVIRLAHAQAYDNEAFLRLHHNAMHFFHYKPTVRKALSVATGSQETLRMRHLGNVHVSSAQMILYSPYVETSPCEIWFIITNFLLSLRESRKAFSWSVNAPSSLATCP